MRLILSGGLAALAVAAPAAAQSLPNPYSYSCAEYLAEDAAGKRTTADFLLYWSVGYLQARLGVLEGYSFTAESNQGDVLDVNGALLSICPNVPQLTIAELADRLAEDFEKAAQ